MKIQKTVLDDAMVIEPDVYEDIRGSLHEIINPELMELVPDIKKNICLGYFSKSKKDVIRGLHYQVGKTQGKLVSAVLGSVFDVIVDMRKRSKTFGQYAIAELNDKNNNILWVPPGFAHGFQCLSDECILSYLCTGPYSPDHERCVKWSDSDIAIDWPNLYTPVVSEKDQLGVSFIEAEYFN